MKSLKFALLMIVAVVFILPSCKKGKDDPFLSLHTRKARVTGKWTLSSGTLTQVNSGSTTTLTFNGTTCAETSGSYSTTFSYTQTITIDKKGTYTISVNDDGNLSTQTGDWYFGRKNKDLDIKNKESIVLVEKSETSTSGGTTTTTTYVGSECPVSTMVMDELKNKEIIVVYDGTYTGTSTSSQTGTLVYQQ